MVARSVTPNNSYRYGYQQAEHYDDLVGGDYDFGARIFDPRIARWLTVDPTKLQNSDWTPYQFGKDCPIVYIDHDGAKEYIYLTSINEQTGKTTVYKMTARALLMTDGIQHHIQDTRETYHYENYYYDFVTHITVTKKKDGSISVQQTTTILKTAAPKDVEYVWFGGDKRGDLKYDNSIEGARGESPCEWCGDNSGSVQQGGVVFSGSNDAGSAAEMYRDAIGKNITVVEGDILDLVGGFPGGESPESLAEKAKTIADGLDKLVSSVLEAKKQIEGNNESSPPIKTVPKSSNSSANSKPRFNKPAPTNALEEYDVIMPAGDTIKHTGGGGTGGGGTGGESAGGGERISNE